MVDVIHLIEEFRAKGGLLGLLKDIKKMFDELTTRASEVYEKAFKRKVTITYTNFGTYYRVFRSAYARARPERKKELEPYLKEFESLWKRFRELRDKLRLTTLLDLVRRGEVVYTMPKEPYATFLQALHRWIADVWSYVRMYVRRNLPDHDINKFYNMMILSYIDVTTHYTGRGGPPRNLEFTFTCFLHIENFVHELTKTVDEFEHTFPVAVWWIIYEVITALTEEFDYDFLYPFSDKFVGGTWDTEVDINYKAREEGERYTGEEVHKIASQLGLDIKDNIAYLEYLSQEFPASFVIYDHDYDKIRGEPLCGTLIWRFPGMPISYIKSKLKPC